MKSEILISELKKQNSYLRKTLCKNKKQEKPTPATHESNSSESSVEEIQTKSNEKQYSHLLRKCIYFALSNQVPVERAGLVVKYTVETLTGKAVNNVPAATASSQMVLEMNVLSDIQVAECILASPSINLAWDATTVDGMHLN